MNWNLTEWAFSRRPAALTAAIAAAGTADLFYEEGPSALALAAAGGEFEAVALLLDSGATIDLPNKDRLAYTPLIEAIRARHHEVVEYLLARGAALQCTDSRGGAPLLHACIAGDVALVTRLLERGALVDAVDNLGQTALHVLAEHARSWSSLSVTETRGDGTVVRTGRAHEDFVGVVEVLLARGADPLKLRRGGYAPLHVAAAADDVGIVRALVRHGADVNHANARGYTPLHAAADGGCHLAVEALLALGAAVNAVDSSGFTPLIGATLVGSAETVRCLLAHGADRTARTTHAWGGIAAGDSAHDIARKDGLPELAEALAF